MNPDPGMSERFADLHIHTYYSDGTMSPEEVVKAATDFGLSAISITDHDAIDGITPALEAARPVGLEVISGVELSSDYQGKDIHILGYAFQLADSPLVQKLAGMQAARMERMKKMVAKLKELGLLDIEFNDVCAQTRSDAVGRLHLAKLLVAKGHVPSLDVAFNKYLGEEAPAYFPKYQQTPQEAIKLIKDSGGVAVLAHPMLTQKDELIPSLVRAGMDGLEVYYPNCSTEIINFYLGIAAKHGLLVTGGSDAHGEAKMSTYIGKARMPYEQVEKLKERSRGGHTS
jgi:predicted metal-dependent phosphoesterase TrpH